MPLFKYSISFLDFKILKLYNYDLSATKPLLKSKTFEHIHFENYNRIKSWKDVHVDAKELKFWKVPFEKVMRAENIKTNILSCLYENEAFTNQNFLTMNIRLNFVFLIFSDKYITALILKV